MPGSAFDPTGFSRRAAALVIGATIAAGAAGVGWWQTHLGTSSQCQITAPAAGTVVGSVTLAATCGSTATNVSFQVNGASVGNASALPYSASWNSATIADGTYSLTAVATDGTGGSTTSAAVSITTNNGVSGGSGVLVANEWISPFGSDSNGGCSRHSTKVVDPGTAADCATPQKACSLASAGDVIGVAGGGVYSIGFNLSGCNPASTITYENQVGTFVSFAGASSITNTSNVTLQGDAAGHGVGFSLGYTTFTSTSGAVTNVNLNTVNVYCANNAPYNVITSGLDGEVACNASMQFVGSGVNGVTWNGGDESAWATCLTSCTHTGTTSPIHNTIEPGPQNVTVENITINHYFDLDNNGSSGDHSEAWMIRGGTNILFANDRFWDCSPPPSTGYPLNNSCNSSFVFFGQSGSSNTSNNVTFEQDEITPGYTGMVSFQWAYDAPAATEYQLNLYYNTMDGGDTICGAGTNNKCGPGAGSTITGSNISMVGNLMLLGATGTCFTAGSYSHNVWFFTTGNAAHCDATDTTLSSTLRSAIWTSPQSTAFDYTLKAGSAALNAGENTVCATLPGGKDINGTARPTLTPCDAGAIQH